MKEEKDKMALEIYENWLVSRVPVMPLMNGITGPFLFVLKTNVLT